jgi:serine/threonine protein kinase
MIVMDRVDGNSIWQLQEDKMPVPEIVARSVTRAIELLHENDIVFGDLRDSNILYDASKARVVLVDFDWSGKDGESRYPAMLNPSNSWAEDVSSYGIMHKLTNGVCIVVSYKKGDD